MESICFIREIYRAISEFESELEDIHGLSINEAMALCCLKKGDKSASEMAQLSGMKSSHTSKIIRSIEEKGLVERTIGSEDKRQMYFRLTETGIEKLRLINEQPINIPEPLRSAFASKCTSD